MQHPPKKQRRIRSRAWMVAGAAALLALAAAFVLLVPKILERYPAQTKRIAEEARVMQTLEIREAAELASVVMHPSEGESYTLVCEEGRLYLQTEDGLQSISDVYHDDLLEALTQIVAQETVAENAADVEEQLADMGLAPARASAQIRYTDGSEATLEVGDTVPNTTYAYYRWSGDEGVYMCDSGIAETFALTSVHLLPVEQPVLYASLVSELALRNANGESRFVFSGSSVGSLEQPYVYPLSADSAGELTTALQSFRLGTLEGAVTEENRAEYGLEDPLCVIEVRQKKGFTSMIDSDGTLSNVEIPAQSLRFVLGREDGEYFYTCEYEGNLYRVSRFLVQQLVEADWANLITRTPAAVGDESIAFLRIEAPQGTVELHAERTERVLENNELETDENGEIVYDTTVTLNGKAGTEEQLQEITDRLNAFAVSGAIPQNAELAQTPRWVLEWETESGTSRRIEALRMDAFSDALRVDGVLLHYTHSDAIESLISGFLP